MINSNDKNKYIEINKSEKYKSFFNKLNKIEEIFKNKITIFETKTIQEPRKVFNDIPFSFNFDNLDSSIILGKSGKTNLINFMLNENSYNKSKEVNLISIHNEYRNKDNINIVHFEYKNENDWNLKDMEKADREFKINIMYLLDRLSNDNINKKVLILDGILDIYNIERDCPFIIDRLEYILEHNKNIKVFITTRSYLHLSNKIKKNINSYFVFKQFNQYQHLPLCDLSAKLNKYKKEIYDFGIEDMLCIRNKSSLEVNKIKVPLINT